jgi:hypothetical protein
LTYMNSVRMVRKILCTCVANGTVSNRGKNEENKAQPSQAKPHISEKSTSTS